MGIGLESIRKRVGTPPKAEPTPQEITTPKLYVGNLAYEAAESDLFDLFSKLFKLLFLFANNLRLIVIRSAILSQHSTKLSRNIP